MKLLDMPIWQMTGSQFLELSRLANSHTQKQEVVSVKFVYGYAGIARIFGCSTATAARIKASGKIDAAIKQIGRKIIVDADLALELAGKRRGK